MTSARYIVGDVRKVLDTLEPGSGIDLDARNADLALDRVGPLMLTIESLVPFGNGHCDESLTRDGDQANAQAIGPERP